MLWNIEALFRAFENSSVVCKIAWVLMPQRHNNQDSPHSPTHSRQDLERSHQKWNSNLIKFFARVCFVSANFPRQISTSILESICTIRNGFRFSSVGCTFTHRTRFARWLLPSLYITASAVVKVLLSSSAQSLQRGSSYLHLTCKRSKAILELVQGSEYFKFGTKFSCVFAAYTAGCDKNLI